MLMLVKVQIPISEEKDAGPDQRWFTVCECVSPEAVVAIVASLLGTGVHPPSMIRLDVFERE